MFPTDETLRATLRAMPKIELHRHMEGSLRLSTLVEIARQHGIIQPDHDEEVLRPFVQMLPEESRTVRNFLNKFLTLRQFYRSIDVIERLTREVIEDAAADNVRYLELRFTPKALCSFTQLPIEVAVEHVCVVGNAAAAACGIMVRYIVSMNRHEGVEQGEKSLRAALMHLDKGVVGLDLAGNEAEFSGLPFQALFQEARANGLYITIHAGEWAGAASVWEAIDTLGAQRIGHGIRSLEDPNLADRIAERGVALEVCPTSNVLTGTVAAFADHPLPMLTDYGIATTIHTDDPLVFDVTLSDEMARCMTYLKLSLADVKQHSLRAAQAAFLDAAERHKLAANLEAGWALL